MTFKNKELVFQGSNGRDEFKREKVAEQVISLLTSEIDVSPMVIDGDWGTGKTEFCHKLINKFKFEYPNNDIVYVDAFQADHADNPLMTILAEVMGLLSGSTNKTKFIEKAIPVARYALKTVSKAVVSHLLRENTDKFAEGLDEQLQQAADSAIDATVLALLKDHEKAKENLQALQNLLSELAKTRPIVIFIDELDRCRPDFSVQMLEVIKHTFDVEGVKFVLITNTKQLRAAINHCYGPLVDAQRYLDKFLKFIFCLPDNVLDSVYKEDQELAATQHLNNLVKENSVLATTNLVHNNGGVMKFIRALIACNRLSLREVETFTRHIEIFHVINKKPAPEQFFGYSLLEILGVYIFCFSKDTEDSIRSGKVDADKIVELLSPSTVCDINSSSYRFEYTDIVATFLVPACLYNKENHQVEAAKKEILEERFLQEFGKRNPSSHERFAPVLEAIDSLSLVL